MPEYQECPFCSEKVLKAALKCKYCFAMLRVGEIPDLSGETGKKKDKYTVGKYNIVDKYNENVSDKSLPSGIISKKGSSAGGKKQMTPKRKQSNKKKSNALPYFLLVILFLAVVGGIIWFFNLENRNGIIDGLHETNGSETSEEDATGEENREESGDTEEPAANVEEDPEESFVDAALEETIHNWIVSKMGNDDFILMEISLMEETEENINRYLDEQVFVYRVEDKDDGGKSVLIGEPFSDAFFRLNLYQQYNQWEITSEEDLW